jgi:predicted nucleic-acid-binding protein
MKALDTNVLARLLLKDDLTQFKKAQALLASDAQFTAPATVMLELVWVLESNDCSPSEICHGLGLLINLHNFKPAHEKLSQRMPTAWTLPMRFTSD